MAHPQNRNDTPDLRLRCLTECPPLHGTYPSEWASGLCAMDQLVWWSLLARVRLRLQIHLPRRRTAAGDHARTGTSSATADRSGDGNQSDVATAAVRRRLHSSLVTCPTFSLRIEVRWPRRGDVGEHRAYRCRVGHSGPSPRPAGRGLVSATLPELFAGDARV